MEKPDYLYEDFKMHCPFYAELAVDYYEDKFNTLIVTLEDGRKVLYDDDNKSARQLPDMSDISEDRFRREFSYRLSKMLVKRHMTQKDLAEETGLAEYTISRYISKKSTPTLYTANKIANALGCSVNDLMLVYRV